MKKVHIFFILILFVLNGFLVYKLKSSKKLINSANTLLINHKKEIVAFEQNFHIEGASENLELNENIEFIDIHGNEIAAKDLFKTNTIVLRYSESNCKDCIKAEIENLLKNKNTLKDIILIAHYKNKRDLYVYSKEFEKRGLHNIKMYLLPEFGLHIPIEKLNIPYYFCVNSDLRMINFFVPQKSKPKLSESYLSSVSKNFLTNNNNIR